MKVLVACEFSGVVRDAFLKRGYDAVSCDLLPTESPGPHYQGDVRDILNDDWGLMIAHPPCTYLSKAGARWLHSNGNINQPRYFEGLKARTFFMELLNADIPHIAIENPTPLKIFDLPEPSQVIQPYMFGHPFSKRTLLWLRNLPKLKPTNMVENFVPLLPSNTGGKKRGERYSPGVIRNSKDASITFKGVADAMADQWGNLS